MYINLQILLGVSLSTLALASWIPTPARTDHSVRTKVDDPTNINQPFTLTSNGLAVGYGTTEVVDGGFKALVLQPPGVAGSTFTLVEGVLITDDNMNVCRWIIEDRSLLPKRMYAAPKYRNNEQLVRWQASGQKLTLLQSGAESPVVYRGASPEGLDWLQFPLIPGGPEADLSFSDADGSSFSFLINQEHRPSHTSDSTRDCL